MPRSSVRSIMLDCVSHSVTVSPCAKAISESSGETAAETIGRSRYEKVDRRAQNTIAAGEMESAQALGDTV